MALRGRVAAGTVVAVLGALTVVPASAWTQGVAAAPARTAAAAAPPVVIGVDHLPPAGKNWEYTHYFPETGVSVPQGGTVLFQWAGGSLQGVFHTVTLLPTATTEAVERQIHPTITTDIDNGESDTVIPSQTAIPSSACTGIPTAPKCVFDGTAVVNSGVIPTTTGAGLPVQISASTPPGVYHYICLVHPGMSGTLTVVPAGQPASDPAALAAEAAADYNQLNAGAAAAEAAASVPTSTVNLDGSRTWKVHVGLTADDVDIDEYLPASLPISKGDFVTFDGSGTTQEWHTATTFGGLFANYGFFGTNQCESATGADTPVAQPNGPPSAQCADPSTLELAVNLASQGEQNVISSDNTAASAFLSGRADTQALGGPTSHTYRLPANGQFVFVCTIHANMFGIYGTPGYRVATSAGGEIGFGAVDYFGSKTSGLPSPVVASPPTLDNQGYWQVTADGHTYAFGDAKAVGNAALRDGSPIAAAVATIDGGGLWLVSKDGRVYALGDATAMGDLAGVRLAAPIVGIDSDGSNGYDLAAADGGVFTFGAPGGSGPSRFFGSLGATHLNKPIVAIADTVSGNGYYLIASDGGVFTFGDATYSGSLGAVKLASPIVGIGLNFDGVGYTLVAADGGVFPFGTAPFLGSAAPVHPTNSAIAIN